MARRLYWANLLNPRRGARECGILVHMNMMMRLVALPVASVVLGSALVVSAPVTAEAKVSCTKSSSGKCIKRGQFCAKAAKGKVGYDVSGRKIRCKPNGSRYRWL